MSDCIDLPALMRARVRRLDDIIEQAILAAIDHYDGNMTEAARQLGISRSTLYRKLNQYKSRFKAAAAKISRD